MTRVVDAIPIRRAKTDLRALLASALEVFAKTAEGLGIELAIEIPPASELPEEIWIDPEKIAWAVATLVGNALRYVKPGTRRMPGGAIAVRLPLDAASAA